MPQVDEWVAEARQALAADNRLVARGYLRRAAAAAPDRLDIWLDLYEVTELPADRKRCLERITALDPGNVEARSALEEILQKEAEEEEAAAASEAAADAASAPDPTAQADGPPPKAEWMGVRLDISDEMRRQWDEASAAGEPLYCINHEHRETALRCNRCGAPICASCAVRTPVGFRCAECIRAQQSIFFTARWSDYPIAALIALLLAVPAAAVAGMVGWWFALIISPLAGGLIGAIVHRAIGRRRGRWMWLMVGACMVLGALVVWLATPSALIAVGIHTFTATSAAVGVLRLRGPR